MTMLGSRNSFLSGSAKISAPLIASIRAICSATRASRSRGSIPRAWLSSVLTRMVWLSTSITNLSSISYSSRVMAPVPGETFRFMPSAYPAQAPA